MTKYTVTIRQWVEMDAEDITQRMLNAGRRDVEEFCEEELERLGAGEGDPCLKFSDLCDEVEERLRVAHQEEL